MISVKGCIITGCKVLSSLLLMSSYPELFFGFRLFINLETFSTDAGSTNILVLLDGILFRYFFKGFLGASVFSAKFFPTLGKYFANLFEISFPV